MTIAFTEQDFVDIRRHCGFGLLGSQTNQSLMYYRYWPEYVALEYRLNHMEESEIALVQGQFLPNLNQLEADIYTVRTTLTASQAAVYHHNDHEMADRVELYNYFRKQLCALFQIPPGPFFVTNAGSGIRFIV